MREKKKIGNWLSLVVVNFIYACTSLFTKLASKNELLSNTYLLSLLGAALMLGIYALLWQQIIRRVPVGDAYMFKGLSIIFVLFLAYIFFGEVITIFNIIGAVVIICGIALHAKS